MTYLTIGHLSAVIAAVIAILQFLLPNALVLVLVSALSDNHTAVTWSVVGRSLGNSLWPLFLRSDTTASKDVSTKVRIITWLRPIGFALIAVAAVVTPIGLYETIGLSRKTQMVSFIYIRDVGPMGYGTPPRSGMGFSRSCGASLPKQCPGTTVQIFYSNDSNSYNATIPGDDYDKRIPKDLAKLYQSGLSQQQQSVSSFFDIQSRQYSYRTKNNIGNNTYMVDSYRKLASLILDDAVQPVEGLIVDTHAGRLGFRNHTAPTSVAYTAEWDEDLLFLEPETVCVNTNLTVEIQIPEEDVYTSAASSYIVDQGGFVNINKTNPFTDPMYRDTQTNPMLTERAYVAAWAMNVLNMYYLNITKPGTNRSAYMNSEIGKRFAVNNSFSYQNMNELTTIISYNALMSAPSAYEHLNGSLSTYNQSIYSPVYPNPFNITSVNFTDIQTYCQGFEGQNPANLTNIGVQCGLVLGVAQRIDKADSLVVESGSWWTRSVYSCASVTKASIKNVQFRFNVTSKPDLQSLKVLNVIEKTYANQSAMPLWGVETPKMRLYDIDPLWGLIDPALANSVNLSTIRSNRLYLPASAVNIFTSSLSPSYAGHEFVPASSIPPKAWYSAYYSSGSMNAEYTGANNLQLYLKWREMSQNASGAAEILNLIWTDYSANALVGTKSWISGNQLPPDLQKRQSSIISSGQTANQVPVHVYERKIRYRWAFGIPAALSLIMVGIICLAALGSLLSGRGTPTRVRHYMWRLSAGRILASFTYPRDGTIGSDTKRWTHEVGRKDIRIFDDRGAALLRTRSDDSHLYQELHQMETKDGVVERTIGT